MQVKREAKIYKRNLPSGNVSYRVDMGMVNGKRQTKDFQHEIEALNLKAKWDAELHRQNLGALQDLAEVQRREVLLALKLLEPFGADILEAVKFYIRHAKPSKGPLSVNEAVEKFLETKLRTNRRPRYVSALADSYLKPLKRAFPGRITSDLTSEELKRFIYAKGRSPKTVANYLRSLSVFFNFLIREGHCSLNPLARLEKPILDETKANPLTVQEATAMLQTALNEGRKPECACMALVLFCGVRVEEVERLSWTDVRLEQQRVHLEAVATKKRRRRINDISENALVWLNRCKGEGAIAPKNYDKRMRYVREKAGVQYRQNSMRHSFASYHVAKHENAAATALMLGHPDANLLFNTYRDFVAKEDAVQFWEILPADIVREKENEKAEKEAEKKLRKATIRERLKRGGSRAEVATSSGLGSVQGTHSVSA